MKQEILYQQFRQINDTPETYSLRNVGHFRIIQQLEFGSTIHHLFIAWCLNGPLTLCYGDREITLNTGESAVIIPPERIRLAIKQPGTEYCWITADGQAIDELIRTYGLWSGIFTCPQAPTDMIYTLGNLLKQSDSPESMEEMRSHLIPMVEAFSNDLHFYADDKKLFHAERLIHQNIATPGFSVESIARKLSIHRKSLYELFRVKKGYSVQTYINNIKMERARNLLRYSDLNVSQITDQCGFNDTAYFSKAFKKNTEMTPLEFRAIPAHLTLNTEQRQD